MEMKHREEKCLAANNQCELMEKPTVKEEDLTLRIMAPKMYQTTTRKAVASFD